MIRLGEFQTEEFFQIRAKKVLEKVNLLGKVNFWRNNGVGHPSAIYFEHLTRGSMWENNGCDIRNISEVLEIFRNL